ncbi:hypothetical protein [Streptococcus ferus]|uniref:hypothetical protein n=1 Tax=Streptococcus ferus TaxID=1345 RepID=UPI0035186FE9
MKENVDLEDVGNKEVEEDSAFGFFLFLFTIIFLIILFAVVFVFSGFRIFDLLNWVFKE